MTPNPFVLAAALLALSGPATAEVYLARCKMGECIHYEQSGRRVEAQGSAAVPGELVRVRLREAVSGSPDTRTANLQWGAPSEVRFFCSTARPAYRLEGGGFQGLDLGQVFGATEMVSTMYLRACHASVPGGTVEAALQSLRYRPTPDRTYEGRVTGISYCTQDGSLLRRVTPPEAAPVDAAAAGGNLVALRSRILSDARIPALGTRWEEAAPALTADWPVIASDDFVPYGTARQLAFLWQDGAVLSDQAHDPEESFKVFLQQVPGAWMPQDGVSIDVTDVLYGSGAGVVDTRALGPGLACYTPGVPDRCAVLVFAPFEGSHVLTGAYGVLEQPAAAAPEAAFRAYAGAAAEAFTGLETMADYDSEAIRAGDRVPHPGSRGVPTYAAGAGAAIAGKPIYDPLKNTTDVNPIARELALYAIGGAEDRTPMVFVMGR